MAFLPGLDGGNPLYTVTQNLSFDLINRCRGATHWNFEFTNSPSSSPQDLGPLRGTPILRLLLRLYPFCVDP
jgi:hypothetical protein